MSALGNGTLLTCDLICYGVASPKAFQEHLKMLEKHRERKIRHYAHRGHGISTRGDEYAEYEDGSVEQGTARTRVWSKLWYHHLVRSSCFACGYHTTTRPGNLTLGDYWGIDRVIPGLEDNWGVSCVLVNDSRGMKLLQMASDELELLSTSVAAVANDEQPMLYQPPSHDESDRFWALYRQRGYEDACKALGLLGWRQTLRALKHRFALLLRSAGVLRSDDMPGRSKRSSRRVDADERDSAFPCAYAAKNRSETIRQQSSSGGVFHALASCVIEDGGVVYGCAFDAHLEAKHIRCETMGDVERCMGSKYTQSDMTGIIDLVKSDLANNRMVLFTGTPCQVAAIRQTCETPKTKQNRSTHAHFIREAIKAQRKANMPADPSTCCGCSACAAACAHDAITMKPDERGFAYPHVDTNRCTGCEQCIAACAFEEFSLIRRLLSAGMQRVYQQRTHITTAQ